MIAVREQTIEGVSYVVLRRSDLCEFLAKKDYLDSWQSEMHERFCFFSHQEWVEYLKRVGFEVTTQSRAITNEWLIENRFAPAADVYVMSDETLTRDQSAPTTNTLLIARKPL